jgi:hypothetical protein
MGEESLGVGYRVQAGAALTRRIAHGRKIKPFNPTRCIACHGGDKVFRFKGKCVHWSGNGKDFLVCGDDRQWRKK